MGINKYTGKEEYVEYEDGTRVLLDEDDSPPLSDEGFAAMQPARDVLPPAFWKALEEGRVGRPKSDNPKTPITIRIDPEVLAGFKAGGKGWQTQMNAVLKDWISRHPPQ